MQATITYLLTEQAQRAQMAATGQPVARKQTMTIEISAEDLPLCTVGTDGGISLDATAARHWNALLAAGWHEAHPIEAPVFAPDVLADIRRGNGIQEAVRVDLLAAASAHVLNTPGISLSDMSCYVYVPKSLLRADQQSIAHKLTAVDASKWDTYGVYGRDLSGEAQAVLLARHKTAVEAWHAKQSAAVDFFFAHPALRLTVTYHNDLTISTTDTTAGNVTLTYGSPRYDELSAEAQRRNAADEASAKAAAAAKEALKTAAIDAFVAASGDGLLIQQHAEKLLCRKTVIARMADAALDACGLPAEYPDSTVCDDSDCPCGDRVVDCIPPAIYAAWKSFTLPEGSTVEFRRVRDCRSAADEEWEDNDDRATAEYYVAVVTIPSGPFQFTRRVRLG
jgi:hypothetical protein